MVNEKSRDTWVSIIYKAVLLSLPLIDPMAPQTPQGLGPLVT
jgi:hypothetical protein